MPHTEAETATSWTVI